LKNINYIMMDQNDARPLPGGVGYFSSDEKIAFVEGDKMSAISPGSCIIYSVENGAKREYAHVTVGWPVQNPILPYSWDMCIPDAEAHNFDGRIHIYGSLDTAIEGHFCSPYYASLSTDDLKRWESRGYSFTSFDGVSPYKGRVIWDPDGSRHGGKYLLYGFYEPDDQEQAHTFVLESHKPEGRFANFEWLTGNKTGEKINAISSQVFEDDDGQRYIVYAPVLEKPEMNYPVLARLVSDSVIDEDSVKNLGLYLKDFYEGPSLRKRGDIYYFIYGENCGPIGDGNHTPRRLSYATSRDITGDYIYRGTIITLEDIPGEVNIHGSIEQIGGAWCVFYHRTLNGVWNKRSLCVEKLSFDEHGLIRRVLPTSSGLSDGFCAGNTVCFNTAVILKNCRLAEGGEYGGAKLQGYSEIGFRYIVLTGAEKELRLYGDGLENITNAEVKANGDVIGIGLENGVVRLANVKPGKAELVFVFDCGGEVFLETFKIST